MDIYSNFTHTYTSTTGTFKYPTFVRFNGTVIAFAMNVQNSQRGIYYAILNETPDAEDTMGWPDNPTYLSFPNEISTVGESLLGTTKIPRIKNNASHTEVPLSQQFNNDELSNYYSTTARLSADAPFQVLADQKYIYVFRQAISSSDPNTVYQTSTGWATTDRNNANVTNRIF